MREITGEVDIPADWNLPEGAYVKNGLVYGGKPLGVGGAYCGCQRAGRYGFISFEDDELLKLPDLQTMCLEKESDNA
ncbi:hypothetical protein [Desulfovibrio sp.]|uniref:hypothetical protein n=1 Tax=Desulfovibrio sp. TaxID=885 RepID=UPI003D115614